MDFAPAPARGEGGRRADQSGGEWRADGAPTAADLKGETISAAARLPQNPQGMKRCVTDHWPARRRTTDQKTIWASSVIGACFQVDHLARERGSLLQGCTLWEVCPGSRIAKCSNPNCQNIPGRQLEDIRPLVEDTRGGECRVWWA
jgi:hypothetical protein